jgi:hypothetical protein
MNDLFFFFFLFRRAATPSLDCEHVDGDTLQCLMSFLGVGHKQFLGVA